MKLFNFFKTKKILIIFICMVIITAIIVMYFLYLSRLPVAEYEITINPEKLLPFVSPVEVRTNVCGTMNGRLFNEVCQKKYDKVGKNDKEKIDELVLYIEKIKESNNISDYERMLLSQAIFAALPTKDSQLAQVSMLSFIKNTFNRNNFAYAKQLDNATGMSEEDFRKMMMEDLEKIVGDLPKGDNAWILSINVSKYEWINGERQPLYSEQYGESYNPFPGDGFENKTDWEMGKLTHVRSRVASFSVGNVADSKSSSMRIAYSFNIVSWHSKPYDEDSELVLAGSGPEKYLISRHNFTEDGYKNEDFLANLLNAVKMPSREKAREQSQKKKEEKKKYIVPPPGTPISYAETFDIAGTPECEFPVIESSAGLYCFDSLEMKENFTNTGENNNFEIGVINAVRSMEPTYPYSDAEELSEEWDKCIKNNPDDSSVCDEIYSFFK